MKKTLITSLMSLALGVNFAFAVGVGDPAPDFTLNDTNGNSHTLSNYQGKVVVLMWFGYS